MFSSMSSNRLVAIILLCAAAIGVASGDDEQKQVITRDAINLTVPNPFGETPIFETNDQNGRYVGLHIPGSLLSTKIKTTILSGLIRMNYDRVPLSDGQRHGPIQFSVLGFSLYDNKEEPYA